MSCGRGERPARTWPAGFRPVSGLAAPLLAAVLATGGLALPRPAAAQEPTRIQFSAGEYSVSESAGFASITVTRTGDLSGISFVNLQVTPGSATPGEDYVPLNPDVEAREIIRSFDVGQASATFFVPVLADQLLDGDETVNLALVSPEGAALGGPDTATLVIRDDAARTRPRTIVWRWQTRPNNRVRLDWTDDSENEAGFEVQRSVGNQREWRTVDTVGSNVTSFVQDNLRSRVAYYYRVRAVRGAVASDWSPLATFVIGQADDRTVPGEQFRLQFSTRRLEFGRVTVNRVERRSVRIRNVGRTTQRLRVGGVGDPFMITRGSGEFSLRPGRTLTVQVTFRPTARGRFADAVTLSKAADGTVIATIPARGTGR